MAANRNGFLLLNCFLYFIQHSYSEYTFENAEQYLYYSYSAYCPTTSLSTWNCYWCTNATYLSVTNTFYDADTNTFGYIGFSDYEIIVSFRGTEMDSLKNWIDDLDTAETTPYNDVPNAEVHEGFYTAYEVIGPQVRDAVTNLKGKYPSYPIIFTGHSLGAALSELAAVDIVDTFSYADVFVWNFGCPRVGNEVFADYYNSKIPVTYRSVNQKDMVPHLPLKAMGFWHVIEEVWYPENPTEYIFCSNETGEDPLCSDSVDLADSIFDHLDYLGHYERDGKPFGC